MKKVSITLLLILPFILIYAISILGKIYSKYAHIKPEYVAVFVDDVRQEEGVTLDYDLDELGKDPIPLDIRVMPTLASNRTYKVENTNPAASEIKVDENNDAFLYLKDKGVSKYVVTSLENVTLKYTFNVNVEYGKLKDFEFFDFKNQSVNFSEITIPIGRTREIGVEYIPNTTRQVFKDLVWTFTYNNQNIEEIPSFSPIKVDIRSENTSQANIQGLREGTVIATVYSKELPELVKTLVINVTEKDEISRAYFNYFDSEYAFRPSNKMFDFKMKGGDDEEGKILFNDSSLTYEDCVIKCDNPAIDQAKLADLIIENTTNQSQIVAVDLYIKNTKGELGQKVDSIVVRLNKAN